MAKEGFLTTKYKIEYMQKAVNDIDQDDMDTVIRNATEYDEDWDAGCNKSPTRTVLGAQLYKSENTALNTVKKSINFPLRTDYKIVPIEIKELNDINA